MAAASEAFERLHERVRRWVWQERWEELRDVQEAAVGPILAAKSDVIVMATTAGGKTEAAFLPICSRLVGDAGRSVRALYIGPLKALINDQFRRLDAMCEHLGIAVHRWHGDVTAGAKRDLFDRPNGILLITPESLEALFVLRGTHIERMFRALDYVVIDELHAFIGTERGRQLQSLLHRLEIAIARRVPRIGLSATLGDRVTAAEFLRPKDGVSVEMVEAVGGGGELKIQLRGYRCTAPELSRTEQRSAEKAGQQVELEDVVTGDRNAISTHLFSTLRGSDNLVFANARTAVEVYADLLRRMSERELIPNEFFPHHGNLSKELREDVERILKDRNRPLTAVCTSTLELGIDIGSVHSIAQIGAPPSVASIRQRLGRSGRRAGEASILRMYVAEGEVTDTSSPQDAIHPELVQCIAMLNLLLTCWYEPPLSGALHLSTLVQQILALIAQHGGIMAKRAWQNLSETGPFGSIGQRVFAQLLRSLGGHDLIMQASDGTLLLGTVGEQIVNHYSFYTAFKTPDEYRLVSDGRVLGTLPIDHPLGEGQFLIFAGQRWRVLAVDAQHKVVDLVQAPGGRPPMFRGTGAPVHDRVRQEMLRIYGSGDFPAFLDAPARDLLAEARANFARCKLTDESIIASGSQAILFPWVGSRAMNTIFLQLQSRGLKSCLDGVAITVEDHTPSQLCDVLRSIVADGPADGSILAASAADKLLEKYDAYLPEELLCADYASRALDPVGAWSAVKRVVESSTAPDRPAARTVRPDRADQPVTKVIWTTREWAQAVVELPSAVLLPSRTVFVAGERVAHALRREILRMGKSEALVGTRFITVGMAAQEVLGAAGVRFSTGEEHLRRLRMQLMFESNPALAHYPDELLKSARGWDDAFAQAVAELEAAGLRPEDLPAAAGGPQIEDLGRIWRSVDEQAGTSWTLSRILQEAADSLERAPSAWPFSGPALAVVDGDTSPVEARFLQLIPQIHFVVAAARPLREHYLQRLECIFGRALSETVRTTVSPRASSRERELLQSYLFERPEILTGEGRPRSSGPDGTVHFEEHPGVEAELEATADWVVQQITERSLPLEDIAILLPRLDPIATLLVQRLRRLPWEEGEFPVCVAGGLSLRETSAGSRIAVALRALLEGLSAESLADLLPAIRIPDGPRSHLSIGAALDLAYSMGAVGGTAANPTGGLEWTDLVQRRESLLEAQLQDARQLQGDEDRVRNARNVRDLERQREHLSGVRPGIIELVGILRATVEQENLSSLWDRLRRFCGEWLLLAGDGPSPVTLLDAALQKPLRDQTCAALGGVRALELIQRTLDSLRAPTARFGVPAVYIGTVADAVGLPFCAVRVLGLAEGALPAIPQESPVLPAGLRETLPVVLSLANDRSLAELHRLDRVIRDAGETVVLSVSRTNVERTQREPSSIFIEAAAALGRPNRTTGQHEGFVPDAVTLRRDGFDPARVAAEEFRGAFCLSEASWLDRVAARHDCVPRRWRQDGRCLDLTIVQNLLTSSDWTALDGILGDSAGYPMPGLSGDRPVSTSRLQALLECPHRFLFKHVLGWDEPFAPPSLREIDTLPYGSLFHRVAEAFFDEHGKEFGLRHDTLDRWLQRANEVVESAFAVFSREYPLVGESVRRQQLNRLRRDVHSFLRNDWGDAAPRTFVAVERSFGIETPIVLQIGGAALHVRGYIDRIDIEAGRTLVRDLKTGRSHPRRGKESNADPKRDLQLAVYGMVTRQLANEWSVPAEVGAAYAYADGSGDPERAFRVDFDGLEAAARRWLAVGAALLQEGRFPRTPSSDDCEYCSFEPVCGRRPYDRARSLLEPATGALKTFLSLKDGELV